MEHPSKEKLENYASRRLNAGEMTFVILHLENCADCFAVFQQLLPSAENLRVAFSAESEVFHLDYDEHLRPFVDHEADEIIREIVESHTQTCSNCAFQLRELREFSESFRLREIEESLTSPPHFFTKIGEWFRHISQNVAVQIALPILIVAIGIGAAIWYFAPSKTVEITKNEIEPPILTERLSVIANNNGLQNTEPVAANTQTVNQTSPSKTEPKPSPSKTPQQEHNFVEEIDNLKSDLQTTVRKAVQTEKLALPGFLTILGERLKLRGSEQMNSRLEYPKGIAINDSTPTFKWKSSSSSPDEKYTVEIFDENGNVVQRSLQIGETQWKPTKNLQSGKIYSWELKIENSGTSSAFASKFRVVGNSELAELKSVKSPLIRGIIYASKGLLPQAKAEFVKAKKNHNEASRAKKFLAQINDLK